MIGREDKRTNNKTMLSALKINAVAGCQGPAKSEPLKDAGLLGLRACCMRRQEMFRQVHGQSNNVGLSFCGCGVVANEGGLTCIRNLRYFNNSASLLFDYNAKCFQFFPGSDERH